MIELNPNNKGLRYQFDGLQKVIGEGNAARGFHDEGDWARHRAHSKDALPRDAANLRNYYMTKVALMMSEGAEALEELRSGREADEKYYSHNGTVTIFDTDPNGNLTKPEGVPSEIADIVIRAFDFADEAGFSLIEAILEKLAYNDTRARLHGRQV